MSRPLTVLLLLALSSPALAQGEAKARTSADPAIAKEALEAQLTPLFKDQLIVEADAWIAILQQRVMELTDVELRAKTAEGDEKTQLLNQANDLRTARVAVSDRFRMVLDALSAKGGDIKDYETYLAAVGGIKLDITDTDATVETLIGWLKSPEGGIRWAKNIFFVLTLFAFLFISRIAGGLARRTLKVSRLKISDILRDFFVGTTRKLTMFLGVIIALSMLEVNIGPFLAAIGVVGFIIGFALQETLANFAAGLMILLYRPYDTGEVINAAGVTGKVTAMSLVSTTFTTPDNQTIVVPNGKIWGGVITNITGNPTRRVDMTFGIGYGDDIAKAQKVLEDIVTSHELVLKDPAPAIMVSELGDSSVNFAVRPWVNTGDYWTVHWDLMRGVKERFDAEGISIPFPQRDVHIHQVEAAK